MLLKHTPSETKKMRSKTPHFYFVPVSITPPDGKYALHRLHAA